MKQETHYGIHQYKEKMQIQTAIARVIQKEHYKYKIVKEDGTVLTAMPATPDKQCYVGDYVMYQEFEEAYHIMQIYPRETIVSKAKNQTAKNYNEEIGEQILGTNVSQIFVLIAANQRFTFGKLERYLMTFSRDNIKVDVIISKADYSDQAEKIKGMIHDIYPDIDVKLMSVYQEERVRALKKSIVNESTILLVGASGAGKSTLINYLTGEMNEATKEVRTDGKGKHTTTWTSLIYLNECNAYLIDTPGFKTIDTTQDVEATVLYKDIDQLSQKCKFTDCRHHGEPGCAVQQAIDTGELNEDKFNRYALYQKKLQGYNAYQRRKNKQPKEKRQMKYVK